MPGFTTGAHRKRNLLEREESESSSRGPSSSSSSPSSSSTPKSLRASPRRTSASHTKAMQTYIYKKSSTVPPSLLDFVAEIHRESRITPGEEVELGEKAQAAQSLKDLKSRVASDLGRPPTHTEWASAAGLSSSALTSVLSSGQEAKNKLVTSNLRLVQRVVNVYIRNGLSSQYNAGDLMQEGTIALIRAAEKFRPDKGFRFSTYAMYWIRASVKRSQLTQSREISVPQRVQEVFKKFQAVQGHMRTEGRRAALEDVAREMDVDVGGLRKVVAAMEQRVFSLDSEIGNAFKPGVTSLYRFVESRHEETNFYSAERQIARRDLRAHLLHHLPPDTADLLILRFGLSEEVGDALSISEISERVGMKQDKVRRVIKRGLKSMRGRMGEWM